ncbi:MAG: DUF6768 family protein [Bacteroidota bacterium]
MNVRKEDIDQLIKESLNKEEAEFYNTLDQQGMFQMWGNLYTGRLRVWAFIISFFQIVFTGLTVYVGYLFFTADDTDQALTYGALTFIGILLISFMKLWHWMQMDKNAILRELKRLEFQIAVLSDKVSKK